MPYKANTINHRVFKLPYIEHCCQKSLTYLVKAKINQKKYKLPKSTLYYMKNFKESIWFQLIPLFLILVIFLFTQEELYVTLGVIILIGLSFSIKYYKNEWKVLLFGIVLGFIFEIGSDLVYKAQYWENASLFGIPLGIIPAAFTVFVTTAPVIGLLDVLDRVDIL